MPEEKTKPFYKDKKFWKAAGKEVGKLAIQAGMMYLQYYLMKKSKR